MCASALLNLMTQPQCREQLIKEDVAWVLIKLASAEDSDNGTRIACAKGICSLSYSPKGCAALLERKAVAALNTLCQQATGRTLLYAAVTLSNFSSIVSSHQTVSARSPGNYFLRGCA